MTDEEDNENNYRGVILSYNDVRKLAYELEGSSYAEKLTAALERWTYPVADVL